MKKGISLLLVCSLIFSVIGCAPATYRTNSQFDSYFSKKKKVLVFEPDMKIYQYTAGGVEKYQSEWSVKSTAFMRQELMSELDTFDTINFEYLDENDLIANDLEFVKLQKNVFYIVSHSIVKHTYEPEMYFKHKLKNFDYTLGKELSDIDRFSDAEAILFVNGRNYIWTAGRASLALFSGAVALFTGVYVQVPAGKEWLTASLVDAKTGDIIWFNYLPMPGDMRYEKTVRRLSKRLFKTFPEEWRDKEKWEIRKEQGNE